MFTFLKAQAASLSASIVDFLITLLCVEVLHVWYFSAYITGTVLGGIVNFSMGRVWVFDSKENNAPVQAVRYIIVWTGSLLLTTCGAFLVTHYGSMNYILSKVFISLLVGISYNYVLQKKFVFK
jgi:putative flippase GtrA